MPKDSISDEDKALFRLMTQGTVPLKKKTIKGPSQKTSELIQDRQKTSRHDLNPHPKKPEPGIRDIYLSNNYLEEVQAETRLSYCQHLIPRKRFFALQKGEIPWEKKLDLHGLTSSHAADKLLQCIRESTHQGLRCLLIIHGKGGRNHEEAPILKNLVNHWLSQIPQVLAFHSALAKDGGAGAVYVLLKRRRD
jgi:DNA-nicking Smr family endonuclease